MNRTGVVLAAAAIAVGKLLLPARPAHWGATDAEVAGALPGDEVVPHANVTTTRAVTVHAPAAAVWPWLAQLGQGRGGFYSYDAVENRMVVVVVSHHHHHHLGRPSRAIRSGGTWRRGSR